MKNILLFFCFTSLSFFACNDDDNMMMAESALADCTYFKVKVGSKFTYEYYDGNVQTLEVIDEEVVDDNELIVFRASNGDESYLNCDGEMMIFTAEEATTLNSMETIKNLKMELDLAGAIDDEKLVCTINNVTEAAGFTFTLETK